MAGSSGGHRRRGREAGPGAGAGAGAGAFSHPMLFVIAL